MGERKSIIRRVIEEKEKRNKLWKKIEEWAKLGWKTDKLEEIANSESIEKLEEEIEKFEERIKKLRKIGRELDKIDRIAYERELIPIETKLNNPYLLPEIEKLYDDLIKKIEMEKGTKKIDEEISLSLEITNYFNNLLEKFENYKPDYSPIDGYLKNMKWDVKFDGERKIITGILSKKLLKRLIIECELYSQPKNFEKEFSLLANNAFRKKIFMAKCFVVAKANDEMKRLFEKYTHMNFSPYMYVIKSRELIFNKNDFKSKIFSSWFEYGSKPKNMVEILEEIFGKNLFSIEEIESKMSIKREKAMEIVEELVNEYKIMEVEKGKYALVN